ncbi:MAG: ATP-binding cassette domain-containing protein [Anaerohalosphaeraceae bacterium]
MTLNVQIQSARGRFTLDVKMQFRPGITALFGPSGAGKTTLLHCIAGLIRPDSGVITLNGEPLFDSQRKIHIPPYHRRIGIVFQDCLLFPHLSVRGNLEYGQTGDKRTRKQQFEKITALLEIESLLDRGVSCLSGGEKKRVALSRAILANPRWLLLDEPFNGLDQSLKDQIMMYLSRLYEATSVPMILVSHCLDEIIELADEVVFMEKGRSIAKGTLDAGKTGCFCQSQDPSDLREIKHWLIRNHSLRLEPYRSRIRVI